jgi:tetratricopeptide (TPR) repeat protein
LRKTLEVVATAGVVVIACLPLSSCRQNKIHSDHPEAVQLYEEGTADLQAFRFQDAVDKLGHSLELDPSLAEAAISRAMALANLQESKPARRELTRADSLTAAITDDQRRMLAQLRLSRIETSRFHAMGDSLRERMQEQEPNNFHVLENLAEHAEAMDDAKTAIAIWQRVLAANPNHAAAYNKLGYLELKRGAYDEALEHLQKYIFLAPDLANPHDSYGEALMTLGRYEEAEEEFRTSIRMQQDFYPSLINLGRTYLARGKVAKGTAILDKVRQQIVGSDFEREVDLRILTTYLVAEHKTPLAVASRDFIQRYPADPLTPLLRSMVLIGTGHSAQGFAVMDSALAARRASTQYREFAQARVATELFASQYEGLKYDQLGDPDAAATAWAEAVRLMSDNTPFHEQFFHRSRLAGALLAAGQPATALAEIDTMLAVNPRLINVLVLKAQAHVDQSAPQLASAALEQLDWALAGADADYPPRARATALAAQVDQLAAR